MQFLRQAEDCIRMMEDRITNLQAEVNRKEEQIQSMKNKQKQEQPGMKRVIFDEATIAEHDKERGTRMKIDEPKTPYVHEADEPYAFDEVDNIPILPKTFVAVADDEVKALVNDEISNEDEGGLSPPGSPLAGASTAFAAIVPGEGRRGGELVRPQMLDLNLLTSSLETVKKKQDFENHRSQHYNEYERLKQWREKQMKNDEGDEGEEDEDEEGEEDEDEEEDQESGKAPSN
jgi:protein phosphatase inhibitor 2